VPWHHHYKDRRRWPLPGAVAIVGSESQDAVFLDVGLVGPSANQLRTTGEQLWLSAAEAKVLREELRGIAARSDLSAEDRLALSHAVELVEYEIVNRTGIAVVPPTESISSTDALLVATERLGWPVPRRGWRRWLPWETQKEMVYDDRSNEPTATCHLQRHENENALCGYEWEGLVPVPESPPWTDLHRNFRCTGFSRIVGIPKEDTKGHHYRHDWGTGR
jgi:hypothetical protein